MIIQKPNAWDQGFIQFVESYAAATLLEKEAVFVHRERKGGWVFLYFLIKKKKTRKNDLKLTNKRRKYLTARLQTYANMPTLIYV